MVAEIKYQCIHLDSGLCETCFNYETRLAEQEKEIKRLRSILSDGMPEEKVLYLGHKSCVELVHAVSDLLKKQLTEQLALVEVMREALAYGIADDEPDDSSTNYGMWRIHAREALSSPALSKLMKLREAEQRVGRLEEALRVVERNDKTEYDYSGMDRLDRNGREPGPGARFSTPREIASAALSEGKQAGANGRN